MSRIIKARLTKSFAETSLRGFVHSQYGGTCNVKFVLPGREIRMVSLFPADASMPDSLAVDGEFFKRVSKLPLGTGVSKYGLEFSFDGIAEQLTGAPECILPSRIKKGLEIINADEAYRNLDCFYDALKGFYRESGREDGFSSMPEKWRAVKLEALNSFADIFIDGDIKRLADFSSHCIGIGKGLTPSSDDAVIGIIAMLAGASLYGHPAVSERTSRFSAELTKVPYGVFQKLTTDVSIKYLYCAFEGRFSDALAELVKALFEGEAAGWQTRIATVAGIGGTSGMDTLIGVKTALKRLRRRSGTDTPAMAI